MCAGGLFAADVLDVRVNASDAFGGNTRSVLSRCQTRAGEVYDPVIVARDVNALRSSGEFEEISADARRLANGVEVTFTVKRKMRYQAPLTIKGAKEFSESKLSSEAALRDGALYGESDFATAAARVRDYYVKKHYPLAKVMAVPEMIPGGNNCTVTLIIDEGEKRKIDDYCFVNAEGLDEGEMKEAIGVYPWWNPMGWFSDEPASEQQLAEGAAKIRSYLADKGYLDAVVGEKPDFVKKSDDKFDVAYKIDRGILYTINSFAIKGVTRYSGEDVLKKSELPELGSIAGAKILDDAAHRIMVTVGSGDLGLADTRVEVKRVPSKDNINALDITFNVIEGVPVVINEVCIEGNDYTKDKVIRREISLGPGDKMLEDHAERSQKRLENLYYFSRVRYYLRKTNLEKTATGEELRDLVYEVEEKNTGSFMVGVGASSVDSVYLSAELSQSNFDIFAPNKWFRGGGQKGRIYGQVGPRIQSYEASVTEPHLFDRLLELTVEAYRRQRWYDEYDIIRTGAAVTLAYPVKFWPTWEPFGRLGFRLSYEYIEFDDVESASYIDPKRGNIARPLFKDEEDKYGNASELGGRIFWSHDSRNNPRFPTSGSRTQIFGDLVGGDNEYWKLGFNHRQYIEMWKRYKHTLMVGLRAETIDALSDEVPIYNRLFLGGPRTIRGVEYRNVAPMRQKAGGGDWDPWGGKTLACMNIEYTIPVVKMVRVAGFTDLGSVAEDELDFDFSDNFAWTAGLGLRLDIDMFPIRLDFAAPIKKPDHAEKEVFSFTIGYDF